MRPTIDELLRSVNSTRYPERWGKIYDTAMDKFEKNGLEVLKPEFYDRILNEYDMLSSFIDDYKLGAAEIAKDENLSRVLALVCEALLDRENIYSEVGKFELPHNTDGSYEIKYEMFTGIAMVSMADYTYSCLKTRNIPESQIHYAMNVYGGMISSYKARHDGKAGAMSWGWYQLAVDGRLFDMGRLQIETHSKASKRAVVLENSKGDICHLAATIRFHRDGHALGAAHYEDEEGAFDADFVETDHSYIGYPYDEYGRVGKERVELKKSEWRKIISPGDQMVALHIPPGSRMTDELIQKALLDAREFMDTYFPELDYKGFRCGSWLIDRQLVDLLGEDTNISKFCKRFWRMSVESRGRAVFSFVYLKPDVNNVVYEELPENTTLERVLKEHYLGGGVIYELEGFIPKNKV